MTSQTIDAASTPRRTLARLTCEGVIAAAGVLLMALAVGANQQWLDRHFLPSFLMPRDWYVRIETAARIFLGTLGAWLVVVARPRAGRLVARAPSGAVSIAIAAILAVGAAEPVLRRVRLQPAEWLFPGDEPRRQADARLGWTLVPARTARVTVGGRAIEYAVDPAGYRVRRLADPVDPERPTILFGGESIMFGEGLAWEETIPAQSGAMLGLQSANLAVHGFATDQIFLRLQTELPRFRRPVAVVVPLMPALFGRNLDSERPHLGPGLVLLPPVKRWRIESLARIIASYHSEAVIERGVRVTREVLRAIVDLARARGATPLVVVPQLGPEADVEAALRHRLLDGTGVPYVFVEIDPAWRLPWNRHPDARGARAIAAAIAERLR